MQEVEATFLTPEELSRILGLPLSEVLRPGGGEAEIVRDLATFRRRTGKPGGEMTTLLPRVAEEGTVTIKLFIRWHCWPCAKCVQHTDVCINGDCCEFDSFVIIVDEQ